LLNLQRNVCRHIKKIKQRFCIDSGLYYRDLDSKEIIIAPEIITVAGSKNKNIVYFSNEEVDIRKGTRVRITGGVFEGIEGIFMRIQGHKRVVVSLPNLLSVATAHIPTQFIFSLE